MLELLMQVDLDWIAGGVEWIGLDCWCRLSWVLDQVDQMLEPDRYRLLEGWKFWQIFCRTSPEKSKI